ncbi:hypothetical protein CONPUDRAFT_138924 [Coniophora puteana RWD-64-598 SS2]|uniref:Uncharacterized protein n=1 Tax=Coniophora puteana (strain RWD-64-598) TaxID=741705 RepID=A0A5M3MGC2_CONPW|nr:uncharacterized protein CONPUDRAFT_138924 [Coniophora puteana RWD-64-598 SS2]EIW77665.1 hypothetical protein CONPUDRAFT_138924 [Coniophora puteana RWD-64-598 SS2]
MTNKSAVLATEFGDISSMAWTLVACMLGPWFILSIRENHASQINGGSSTTGELVSSILFQVGAPQDDDILIIGNPHHDEDDYC